MGPGKVFGIHGDHLPMTRNLIVTSIKGLTRQQPSQGLGCQSGSRKWFKDEEVAPRA